MGNIIEARVKQKKDTLANWEANPIILLDGEQAFVVNDSGQPVNFKIGDGTKRFSELPFWIQYDQASFVPVSGFELPTPSQSVAYSFLGEGTYTHVSGDVVVPDGHWGVANWDGSAWGFSDMGELPQPDIDKTDTVVEPSERVTTETAVLGYSTPLTSERILPDGNSFSNNVVDRPDVPMLTDLPLILTGDDDSIVGRVSKNAIVVTEIDRPDIDGVIFLDENGNLIQVVENGSGEGGGSDVNKDEVKRLIKESEYNVAYYEPDVQEEYNNGTSQNEYWLNYDYYADFDTVRENQKAASGYQPYVSRELLGLSTDQQYEVYRYEFKPANPTHKIILFGGVHGQERIPPMVLLRFFKNLCENWMHDPVLTWFRHNIHVVVVPLVSPYGFRERNRRVKETDPFPATWTKTGDRVTVTFNVSDFPTTNPNVSASNYFTASPASALIDKLWLSFINSSDQDVAPDNGYPIKAIVDGQTVQFDVPPGSGEGAGTCQIYISADPNRGFNLPSIDWNDKNPNTNTMSAFNEPVSVPFDNKGTKPFSLNESIYVMDTYEEHQDATLAIDIHNGAADYDTRWNPGFGIDISPIQKMNDMHANFSNDQFHYRTNTLDANSAGYIGTQLFNMASFTIEWGGHNLVTEEIATDSQRWLVNFILQASKFYDKKLN